MNPQICNVGLPDTFKIYLSSISAKSVFEFACARIDADACDSTEYFAKFVVSSAISTSTIRPRAARILVFLLSQGFRIKG